MFSRLRDEQWSSPIVIAEGDDFFANWADIPKVGVAGTGTLWAHWLAKIGEDTFAYGIFLARSLDGGESWDLAGTLHDDSTPTEHGFVSYVAEGPDLRAMWLDGRRMLDEEPMTVRTALLKDRAGPSTVLDERVCECCSTDLTATPAGPVAFYRDRSLEEIRNIGVARFDGEWQGPVALWEDDWMIPGCPVNGPAVDAMADRVGAAWFTAADETPRVQLAFSDDGGASFSEPLIVDNNRPLGRVDLELDQDGNAWVSWLAAEEGTAQVKLGRFEPDGDRESWTIATTEASRASGVPRLAKAGSKLYLAWVAADPNSESRIRVQAVASF
jgi:hypothetical protein